MPQNLGLTPVASSEYSKFYKGDAYLIYSASKPGSAGGPVDKVTNLQSAGGPVKYSWAAPGGWWTR